MSMFRRKKRTTIDPDMDPSFLSNKPVGDWTVAEVCHWLKYIGLGQYQDAFFFNEVDGDMLLEIDDDDLITLPVEKITHRRKILRRMEALKAGGGVGGGGISESDCGSEYSQASDVGSDAGSVCGEEDRMGPGGVVHVKCVYHEDVRKFPLGPRDAFEDFIKLVEEEWGSGKGIKYKDEEGDMVQVRETDELQGVYKMSRVRRVRLVVYSLKKKKKHHHHHHHHHKGEGNGSGSESGSERSSTGTGSRRGSLKRRSSSSSIGEVGVLEHFVDPVVISNRRGMITFFNAAAEQLFGWDRGELIGKNVSTLMGPEIAAKHNGYIRRYRKEGNPRIIGKGRGVQALLKSGDLVNIWITISETNTSFIATIRPLEPVGEGEGVRDAGKEREEAEKRITSNHRNLEKELKALNDYPTAVLVMDEGGIIQYTNTKANEELGYHEGGLLGMGMWVVCSAICSEGNEGDLLQEYKRYKKHHKKEKKEGKEKEKGKGEKGMGLLEGGKRRDVICLTANKHVKAFKCEFSDRKHLGKTLYVCSLKPQTEPNSPSSPSSPKGKGISEGAQKILCQQREVTSTLIVPAFILNKKGMIFEANTTCCEVLGACITEIIGQDVNKILPESNSENDWLKEFLSGDGKDSQNTVTGLRGDGTLIPLNLFVNKVHDNEERSPQETFYTCILSALAHDEEDEDEIDILAKQSVVLSQQVDVISNLAIPACVITHDSKIRAFNHGCEQMFGFTRDEVINKDCGVLMPQGEIREKHPLFVANFAAGKKKERDSVVVGKGRKVVGRHKEGHNVPTFLSVTERKDGELSFFTGVFTN